jgi:transcriptional regulator with XRE-family HTH domain
VPTTYELEARPGAAFRNARRAAGLTQFELAGRAGCSLAYVRAVEGGFWPANPDNAAAWSRILRVLSLDAKEGLPR